MSICCGHTPNLLLDQSVRHVYFLFLNARRRAELRRAPRLVISPRRGVLARDQTRIQSVAVGREKSPSWAFLQGQGGNMCPAVRRSLGSLKPAVRWPHQLDQDSAANPAKYHRVLEFRWSAAGIDLPECKYERFTFSFLFGRNPRCSERNCQTIQTRQPAISLQQLLLLFVSLLPRETGQFPPAGPDGI